MSDNYTIGQIPYLIFPPDNKIKFWQDFSGWEGIPSDRMFYPREECNKNIVFVADGYGIIAGDKYGLAGKYGSGAIYVSLDVLPLEIIEWSRNNFLKDKIACAPLT